MLLISQSQRDVVAFFLAVVLAVGACAVCVAFSTVVPSEVVAASARPGPVREARAATAPASALPAPPGS